MSPDAAIVGAAIAVVAGFNILGILFLRGAARRSRGDQHLADAEQARLLAAGARSARADVTDSRHSVRP